jgi:hypothetical protein
MLKTLFPDSPISSNAVIPSENISMEKEDRLSVYEFDVSFLISLSPLLTQTILLPHLSLAFEYQGEHHYFSSYFGSLATYQRRDQAKLKFTSKFGITLIPIPFWWDRTSDSLLSTIKLYRPDIHLQTKKVPPIPLEMPDKFKNSKSNVSISKKTQL